MIISDEDIQTTAQRIIGCELHPIQVEWVRTMLDHTKVIGGARRAGYTTAFRVAYALIKERQVI